jgi:hypothetical protein
LALVDPHRLRVLDHSVLPVFGPHCIRVLDLSVLLTLTGPHYSRVLGRPVQLAWASQLLLSRTFLQGLPYRRQALLP